MSQEGGGSQRAVTRFPWRGRQDSRAAEQQKQPGQADLGWAGLRRVTLGGGLRRVTLWGGGGGVQTPVTRVTPFSFKVLPLNSPKMMN